MYLCILNAMIFFPFHLFAQEEKEIVEHESGFYYTVQEGDTLWDLSQRFSDSPWIWPDLWQENKQIPNPHWIYPGERIRLFHREGVKSFAPKTVEVEKEAAVEVETPKEQPYSYYSPINKVGFMRKTPVSPRGIISQVKDNKQMVSVGDLVYVKQ
ncbi:MAG: LysM peptidoglycan-binding domain-containing protein, partial [Deltaproteobacteria bacterium]|nr:LysM peptidoglycan-binding domain-containing protein [Deltaproteobacteria bacterium]